MFFRNKWVAFYVVLTIFLSACGGSSSNSNDDRDNPGTVESKPSFSVSPANQTVTASSTASFSVTASANPVPTIQWQVSTDGGNSFNDINTATSTTYTTEATTVAMNNWQYRAVASNNIGSTSSTAATLTVQAEEQLPTITTSPTDQSITEPNSATFSAVVTGTPAPRLQWQVSTDGGNRFSNVSTGTGATTESYTTEATTATMNNWQYRIVATNSAGSTNSTAATLNVSQQAAGLIFEDNFDDQPDFTSSQSLSDIGVTKWTAHRNSGDGNGPHYTPAKGFPNGHDAFEITGDDPNQVRGRTGKAFVAYRESYSLPISGGTGWNSDGILEVDLDRDYNELFVRFYIKFQPGWSLGGQSKLFRVRHFDGGTRFKFFSSGNSSPMVLFDYARNQYGLRNFLAFRADPQESNFFFEEVGTIPNMPRQVLLGDVSLNFQNNIRDLNGDGNEDNPVTLIDRLTGEVLDSYNFVDHNQVYGSEWNKIEFYFKMNSAPGVEDGVTMQWINDQLVFKNVTIPFLGSASPGNIGWNVVSLGGNDHWNPQPNENGYEEWYSIDDVEVWDRLPEDKQGAL